MFPSQTLEFHNHCSVLRSVRLPSSNIRDQLNHIRTLFSFVFDNIRQSIILR